MKYRMYHFTKFIITVSIIFSLIGCASMKTESGNEENSRELASVGDDSTIREPASMVGDVDWLNEVQDDFSRIAAETSSRSVASKKPDVLVEHKRWRFLYQPANNQFLLKLDGANYGMVQTSLEDNDNFSFSAEGQAETPITLTVAQNSIRQVAEAGQGACVVELSFWDTKNKKYQKDVTNIPGTRCAKVMNQLRSYVP